MTDFTPFASLAGGVLIGSAAVLLMLLHGRILGATGILAGFLVPHRGDWAWRAAALAGMASGPLVLLLATGAPATIEVAAPAWALAPGGFVVGLGAAIGGGCTSGHGVCGMARLSPRSLVATAVFMTTTAATVFVVRHVLGS